MVSILNNQTSNEEFLEFATNEVHNVDVATTHHGAPSAQVCDLVLNKNGKLYIVTSSQNPFFQDLIHKPKVIIKNVEHEYIDEIFEKNDYLNEIYADDIEGAKEDLRVLEITPKEAAYLDHRTHTIFTRKFDF